MSGGSYLVFRKDGCLWAVPAARVVRVEDGGEVTRLCLDKDVIEGDRVVRGSEPLALHQIGAALSRLVPGGCAALAVFQEEPVITIDPGAPPSCLRATRGLEEGGRP